MTAKRTHKSLILLAFTTLVGGVFMTGCSTAAQYRADLTPRLDARGETRSETANTVAYTTDTNFRNLNNDLGRMWFSDRPSRLTNGPKPY